ncbi:uncharacterized protein METZ01_LOCUS212087 [marine metagenome]|uniref:Uncharacterized protein n=1 Tax=marine metagenome TaxID=408172 RepID=A0A382FAL3_9ZZZZ
MSAFLCRLMGLGWLSIVRIVVWIYKCSSSTFVSIVVGGFRLMETLKRSGCRLSVAIAIR